MAAGKAAAATAGCALAAAHLPTESRGLCLSGQLGDGVAGLADLGFDGLYELEGIVVTLLTNGFDNVVVAVEQGIEAQVATDTLEGVGCCLLYTSPSPRDRG